jgi:hypothetical protein
MADDGRHRADFVKYVDVTPLQPPFRQPVMKFQFFEDGGTLAVSPKDGSRIKALLNGAEQGRIVVLAYVDGATIRVSIGDISEDKQ